MVFPSESKSSLSCLGSYLLIPDNIGAQHRSSKRELLHKVRGDCQWENKYLWDAGGIYLVASVVGVCVLDLTLAMVLSVLDIVQLFLWFCL